jgi:drug/metabolite transporter (DMT)-like permease
MDRAASAWRVSAAALSAVALWGLAFPLIQEGLEDFSPLVLGFLRFALAAAAMAVVMFSRHTIDEMAAVLRAEWRPLLVLGLLYVTVPNAAQNIGLEHGTSSVASVIQSSGPVMTMLFAASILKERVTTMKGLGTVVALAGTVMLVAVDGLTLGDDGFASNLLILLSAGSYGLAWVSAKRMLERNPPMLVIGMSIILGTAMLAISIPMENGPKAAFDTASVANLLVLGVLCAGLSSVLYLGAVEREEVSRMAFFIYLMPVFASVFAWMIRGESVQPWTVVCGAVIALGIAVATRRGPQGSSVGS